MTRIISQDELDTAEGFGPFVPVYKVDSKTIVKTGSSVRKSEAEIMRFIRNRTSIPVPEVLNSYMDEKRGKECIVMEFIPGDNLDKAWEGYTDIEIESVVSQLRGYMEQLRSIKGTFIGSVDGAPCNDQYFDEKPNGYRPFINEEEFNRGIVSALKEAVPEDWSGFTCDIWAEVMTGHEIVMTHNDFDPRNILVRGSEVVALLDWELSGYYPEYWEYCKALRRPTWHSGWIRDRALEKVLQPYRKELSVMWNTREIIW